MFRLNGKCFAAALAVVGFGAVSIAEAQTDNLRNYQVVAGSDMFDTASFVSTVPGSGPVEESILGRNLVTGEQVSVGLAASADERGRITGIAEIASDAPQAVYEVPVRGTLRAQLNRLVEIDESEGETLVRIELEEESPRTVLSENGRLRFSIQGGRAGTNFRMASNVIFTRTVGQTLDVPVNIRARHRNEVVAEFPNVVLRDPDFVEGYVELDPSDLNEQGRSGRVYRGMATPFIPGGAVVSNAMTVVQVRGPRNAAPTEANVRINIPRGFGQVRALESIQAEPGVDWRSGALRTDTAEFRSNAYRLSESFRYVD